MIEIKHLFKSYQIKSKKYNDKKKTYEKHVLNDVSFTCDAGVITCLVGENGAGKTTTMRIIATLIKPDSGSVIVDGYSYEDEENVRGKIGVLFGGDPTLYERLTARENILYFAQLNGLDFKKANEQIDFFVERFQMNDYIDRKTKDFSRGMKQKVAILRSIIHDPDVIIFDEPTTGLDISAASIVHDYLLFAKQENKTILLSTHSMYEVEKLADKVIVINEGKICADGTIDELVSIAKVDKFETFFLQIIGAEQNGFK